MTRLRLGIAYDGTGFSGWARQPGRRSVQQVVEEALGRSLRLPAPPPLTVAGRTDAGVHARGQVAHCDVPTACWAAAGEMAVHVAPVPHAAAAAAGQAVRHRLARALPPDVRVGSIAPAPEGFDARFSAVWRRYSYRVCDVPEMADPLRRHQTLWHRRRLDTELMNQAAAACLGEHDYAAFCRRRDGASTVRTLLRLEWERPEESLAVASVVADAFCHSMVRALVGAMLKVGEGAKPPSWPAQVLAARVRDPQVTVVAAHGLCLEEVGYPADDGLAARAARARQYRGPLPAGSG